MSLAGWFELFAAHHLKQHPECKLPPFSPGDRFWRGIQERLISAGVVDLDAACKLSTAFENFNLDPAQHLAKFSEFLGARNRGNGSDSASCDYETTRAGSRTCVDCQGNGLAQRFRRHSLGKRPGAYLIFYCMCPMGRL